MGTAIAGLPPALVAGSVQFAPSLSRWRRGSVDTDLGPAAYPQPLLPITSPIALRASGGIPSSASRYLRDDFAC